MIYKISHRYREEVFVPLLAIEDNMNFLKEDYQVVETSEGIQCKVTSFTFLNAVGKEGRELIKTLYDMSLEVFLVRWHGVTNMSGLMFCWIKMKKI